MSSLREDHLAGSLPSLEAGPAHLRCWEFLSCTKVLCPAHGKAVTDCWLIARTHCGNYTGGDFFQKLSLCLSCAYFKERGSLHAGGWNRFLAHELQRYNYNALEQLYQKEESFVEILNRIPDGLFTTDQDWRITYFNPAAEKITGFLGSDAVGMYCKDVFKNAICEADCALKRAVADGTDVLNREYVITDIDGRKIPIMCSTSAFRDPMGRVVGGLEIFKDITGQKRLQEEVIRREKRYRRIFEGSHDMIYTTNQAGKILDVNQAGVEMLKYRGKEEMLRLGTAERLYRNPEDRDDFLKEINQEGFAKDYEVEFQRKDGLPIHVLISSRRYENPETGDVEYEGIIKDITHRKITEEALRQRNRELSIVNSIAVALNHTMDLNRILLMTLKDVLKILRLDRGGLFLIDREQKKAKLHAGVGLSACDGEDYGEILFRDEMLKTFLIDEGVDLAPKPTFPVFHVGCRIRETEDVVWLSGYLITFKGKGVGFFGLDMPAARMLSHHEIHLLGSLGNFLGGTIENTRLMKTIRLHRQELRGLTEKLFQTQEEERRRIARELHDEAGQALTAVKLCLDRLEEKVDSGKRDCREEFDEIRKMIASTSGEIRQLSYRLHPTLLSDLGLEPALKLYFREVAGRSGLDIQFRMVGFDRRLDPDTETVLYRFSQEALTNALKHSGAEHFRLSIIKSFPMIIFRAEDDGVGFDGRIRGSDQMSLGLLGMRERASLLGGAFQLRTKRGEGTRIRIEIPLKEAQAHGTED